MTARSDLAHGSAVAAKCLALAGMVLVSIGALPARSLAAAHIAVATVAGGHGRGSAPNQLSGPYAVAVDRGGNVLVADTDNNRVQKWAPGAAQGITVAGGDKPSSNVYGVAIDDRGDLFVSEVINNRVQEWALGAKKGVTVAGGHGSGSAADQLNDPMGVAVDGHGDVFVADVFNDRVQMWAPGAIQGVTVAGGNGNGTRDNQLNRAGAVALDGHGDVFVADSSNNRVQKWAPGAMQGVTVAGGHGGWADADHLIAPMGVAIDGQGNMFIADSGNDRVQEWPAGATQGITIAGGHGRGPKADQLSVPNAVAVDGNGDVYVSDYGNQRIQKVTLPHPNPVAPALAGLRYYTTTSDAVSPPVHASDDVVLVATLNPLSGTVAAQGTVAFFDGSSDLGAAALYTDEATSYAILFTTLPAGQHTISAQYSGDDTFTSADAEPVRIIVTP